MKVLVIEDTETKFLDIKQALIQNKIVNITHKYSRNSGLLELINNQYDLLILDMQIPLDDDSFNILTDGGFEVLDEIIRTKNKIPVIICSSDAINADNYENVVSVIRYNSMKDLSEDFWYALKKNF